MRLKGGIFTLSLDLELIWGTLDLFGPEAFRRRCQVERQVVIDLMVFSFQVIIKHPPERLAYTGYFEAVREPVVNKNASGKGKYLCFVLQPAER